MRKIGNKEITEQVGFSLGGKKKKVSVLRKTKGF